MSEVQIVKRKKKRVSYVEDDKINHVDVREEDEIHDILVKLFKHHVGAEAAISSQDLFIHVYGFALTSVSPYIAFTLFERIKKIIRAIKRERLMPIVVKGRSRFFVLKTAAELMHQRNRMQKHIRNIEAQIEWFERWVNNNEWKELKE